MGSNQSAETRSVSMDNPTPAGVIDVSEEVVQRLKLGLSKVKQQEKEDAKKEETAKAIPINAPKSAKSEAPTPPVTPVIPPVTQKPVTIPKTIYATPTPSQSQSTATNTTTSQYPRLAGEPVITAMEMRRQQEIQLRENDKMWVDRMAQLESNLKKTNEILEKEYATAFEDTQKRFVCNPNIRPLPPCQDLKSQIIACYRTYPKETLKCSEDVDMFVNCVASHRVKRLDNPKPAPAKGA